MEENKVAVIGAGYWGKNIVRGLGELGALGAICDKSRGLLASYRDAHPGVRTYESYGDVLADDGISAVAIAAPAELHGQMATRALLAGRDVYVEKPLCMSAAEGEEIVRLADEKDAVLMVGHLLHYHPAVEKLKELASSGALGEIRYVYSNRLNIGKLRTSEDVLLSFAPHDISVVLALMGCEPEKVETFGGDYVTGGIADTALVTMEFPGGAKAHVFVSWLHPFKEQRLVVVGSRAMAVFDDVAEEKLCVYDHEISAGEGGVPVAKKGARRVVPLERKEPLKEELRHFVECVNTRTRPRTDGAEGLSVLKILARSSSSRLGGEAITGETPWR